MFAALHPLTVKFHILHCFTLPLCQLHVVLVRNYGVVLVHSHLYNILVIHELRAKNMDTRKAKEITKNRYFTRNKKISTHGL